MSYNDLEISAIFEKLWEIYPCKERPAASKKALFVALKSGLDHKLIENAVRIYALENEGAEFHFHFVNFINDDHWKDILSYHKEAERRIRILEKRREMASDLINEWNKECRSHWCECLDVELRIPIVVSALENKPFRDNWKKALDIARKIFYTTQNEKSKFSNLTLSLRWFCTVSPPDKHTVVKLIEGEYGKPIEIKYKKIKHLKPLTKEEHEEVMKDFEDVFKDSFWKKRKKKEPDEPQEKPNEDMKKIVEEIIDPFDLE